MGFRAFAAAAFLVAGLGVAPDAQTTQPRSRAQIEAEREQARFRAMDVNNDRVITRREWQGNARSFDRHDTNHDGLLSGSEIWIPAPLKPSTRDRAVGTSGNDAQQQTRAYKLGHQRGMVEGRQAGKEDKEGPNRWDLEGQRELEQADSGYNIEMGRREDYQAGYRAGFRLGYRQGFGQR
jgi:hypothetical protein